MHVNRPLAATALALSLARCTEGTTTAPAEEALSLVATPYLDAGGVSFYRPFEPGHEGFDFSTQREVAIRAPSSGRFERKLYYHAGVPRWQLNATIYVGDRAAQQARAGHAVQSRGAQRRLAAGRFLEPPVGDDQRAHP